MTHLQKRFTDDQVKVLFRGYCQGLLPRGEISEMLNTGKPRFFGRVGDGAWRKLVLQTDDVDTQWGRMMRVLGVEVTYALSPCPGASMHCRDVPLGRLKARGAGDLRETSCIAVPACRKRYDARRLYGRRCCATSDITS
ncbi:MAG: hypothetical protein MUQ10_16615 [Anaerolineae bacterium]|nr:hypothetical protein [Anaerolineae bacterium]